MYIRKLWYSFSLKCQSSLFPVVFLSMSITICKCNKLTNVIKNYLKFIIHSLYSGYPMMLLCMYIVYYLEISLRLVGGSSYNEGRVEVYYNGEWGTVCDDGWDDTDAGVVCRQLGFGSSGTSYSDAYFGQGSGSIWLDNIDCTGNELTLVSCGHLGVNVTRSCSHNEDAGIRCHGKHGITICCL